MTATRHARLSASSAPRWLACPGSVNLSKGLVQDETEYQREGKEAHAHAETILRAWPYEPIGLPPLEPEMAEAVAQYVNVVRGYALQPGARLYVEQTFSLALLQPPEEMFGTADTVVVNERARELTVIDLKYGRGVAVEVRNNPQTLIYAVGALLKEFERWAADPSTPLEKLAGSDFDTPLDAAIRQFDLVRVVIVQPRAPHPDGPVRTVEIDPKTLPAFIADVFAKARATQQPNAPLVPGPHCRFCPAQAHCPALVTHAQAVAQLDFAQAPLDVPPSPEHLPLALAAELLAKAPVLEDWIRGLRQRITRELEAGHEVPGWKLVPKRALREWADEAELVKWATEAGLEPSEFVKQELRSPAQLEAVIGKGNIPEPLVVKVSSGLTLVPATDARPAVGAGPQHEFAALPPASGADLEDV